MNFHGVILDDQLAGTARIYREPLAVHSARTPDELAEVLETLQGELERGRHLAGWIAYEAGAAVEPALRQTLPDDDNYLIQAGVFEGFDTELPPDLARPDAVLDIVLEPTWSEAEYTERFEHVQRLIQAGDVYQVNLTFHMTGETDQSAGSLFRNLRTRQSGAYGALVSLCDEGNGPEIISLSPELFIRIDGGTATLRPMKGTLARLPDPDADAAARQAMTEDPKSRAENLMIVDLLRNDLSRLARPGSVRVPELFTPETYATLHQMTSTVTGEVGTPTLSEIISALFPCGSVTGAPKIRAMEIIADLEDAPRGPYCGSVFSMDPPKNGKGGSSCFNVAIRTLVKRGRALSYSVGSGVVADSVAADEYRECLLKADVLRAPTPSILETFRMAPRGFLRLPRHLARMERSALALGWPFDARRIAEQLAEVEADEDDQRIRIELFPDSRAHVTVTPLTPKRAPLRVVAGSRPLTPDVQPTAHKTSARAFYDVELARAVAEGADEAVLLNARGEVCEGTWTSVFVERDGMLLTPPLSAGLLPGILREHLLEEGRAREATLRWQDLLEAETLYMGNSLRGLMLAVVV